MKNVHAFVPVFLYAVTMLIFQIKRIISSKKWYNYVVTFFFENAQNLGRSDDGKRREKKRMALAKKKNQTYSRSNLGRSQNASGESCAISLFSRCLQKFFNSFKTFMLTISSTSEPINARLLLASFNSS